MNSLRSDSIISGVIYYFLQIFSDVCMLEYINGVLFYISVNSLFLFLSASGTGGEPGPEEGRC